MNGDELDLDVLHQDDRLLDALAERRPVPPEAGNGDDLVTGLLAAFAADIDECPVGVEDPAASQEALRSVLAALATNPDVTTGAPVNGHAVDGHAVDGHAVDGHAVDGHAVNGHAVNGAVRPLPTRTRRGLVWSRAAAAGVAGMLVLGVGGAAAAVTGQDGFQSIRRVVASVIPDVRPSGSAATLLDRAAEAIADGDLERAESLLKAADRRLDEDSGVGDVAMRQRLATLRDQIDARRQARPENSTAPSRAGADAAGAGTTDAGTADSGTAEAGTTAGAGSSDSPATTSGSGADPGPTPTTSAPQRSGTSQPPDGSSPRERRGSLPERVVTETEERLPGDIDRERLRDVKGKLKDKVGDTLDGPGPGGVESVLPSVRVPASLPVPLHRVPDGLLGH